MAGHHHHHESRIPQALQAVFLAAGRGKDVHLAPPDRVAMKTFRRPRFQNHNNNNNNNHNNNNNNNNLNKPFALATRAVSTAAAAAAAAAAAVAISGGSSTTGGSSRRRPGPVTRAATTGNVGVPVVPDRHHISPHAYLNSILNDRGYTTSEFDALATAYYNRPTQLQQASYGLYVVDTIRHNRVPQLIELLEAGISPNACNEQGESLVHLACRLGLDEILHVLVNEYHASVQIVDAHGRTPLHELCLMHARQPPEALLDIIMGQDPYLWYLRDRHGMLPLQCIRDEDCWDIWTKYLMSRKDQLWPDRDIKKVGWQPAAPLAVQPPHSRPLPENSQVAAEQSLDVLELVAQGCIAPQPPQEATLLITNLQKQPEKSSPGGGGEDSSTTADETASMDESAGFFSGTSSVGLSTTDEDYDTDDDDFSFSTFDEEEMAKILGKLGNGRSSGMAWSSVPP